MQKLALFALTAIFPILVRAQSNQTGTITAKISTPTVRGEKCKILIENYMKHEDGVLSINVDWRRKITTVKFAPAETNINNIETAIANCGFDADSVSANPDSYKALTLDCKKAADGGPPDKKN